MTTDRYTPGVSGSLVPEGNLPSNDPNSPDYDAGDSFRSSDEVRNSIAPQIKHREGVINRLMPTTTDPDSQKKIFGILGSFFTARQDSGSITVFRINENAKIYQSSWDSSVSLRGDFSKNLSIGNQIRASITSGDQYSVSVTLNLKPNNQTLYTHKTGHQYPVTSPTQSGISGIASGIVLDPVEIVDDMDLYNYGRGTRQRDANNNIVSTNVAHLAKATIQDWRQGSGNVNRSDMRMSFMFLKDAEPGKTEDVIDLGHCNFSLLNMMVKDRINDYVGENDCIEVRPTDFTEENLLEPYFTDSNNAPIKIKMPSFVVNNFDSTKNRWDWITYIRGKEGYLAIEDMFGAELSTTKAKFITSEKREFIFTSGRTGQLWTLAGLWAQENYTSCTRGVGQVTGFATEDFVSLGLGHHSKCYGSRHILGLGNGSWHKRGATFGPLWELSNVNISTELSKLVDRNIHGADVVEMMDAELQAMGEAVTLMHGITGALSAKATLLSTFTSRIAQENLQAQDAGAALFV